MSKSEHIYENTLGCMLTLYITSCIVFYQNYIWITYFLGFSLIIVFLVFLSLKKKPLLKFSYVVTIYGALTFVAIASSFWAVNFDIAAKKSFQMIYILINMFIVYNVIKIYSLEKYFMYGILTGTLANFIFLLGPFSPPFEIYQLGRAMGSMGNANVLAILMNFSVFTSILYIHLYKPKRYFSLYLSVNIFLALYIIFITASKKGLILATILILMFLISNLKNIKKLFIISIMIIVAVIIFKSSVDQSEFFVQIEAVTKRFEEFSNQIEGKDKYGSTAQRLKYIKTGMNLFENRSILGYGIDNFRTFSYSYSHNNYIEILVGLGLVGLSLLMLMYSSILYNINKIKNNYLKFNLFTIMTGMMLMDIAMVTYYIKITLFFIVFLSIIIENNIKEFSYEN